MKKVSDTYKELGIDFIFPIEIKDAKGNETYFESSDGYWYKCEYGAKGNETYFESSDGYWCKCEYDANGNETYSENSSGNWYKFEYDAKGNETYFEDSRGYKRGTPQSQSCAGKVIEVDGKKYKLEEL
jgi:YD repeat-containing protein